MSIIPMSVRLQGASDDAAEIADTVKALCALLDRFHERHGDGLGRRLTEAFPQSPDIGTKSADPIYALSRSLEPPDCEPEPDLDGAVESVRTAMAEG